MLALIAEGVSGEPFHDLVVRRACEPAGMTRTSFLRTDELPDDAALGYLDREGDRTNALKLPARCNGNGDGDGDGDGGIYSTAADLHACWDALLASRIVSRGRVDEMLRPRSAFPREEKRYGLGFHIDATRDDVVWMEGYDAGASMLSTRISSLGPDRHRDRELDRWRVAGPGAPRRAPGYVDRRSIRQNPWSESAKIGCLVPRRDLRTQTVSIGV
ncbi:MAG: serine hydrolase domain-containing protein [Actinomycetota bacterium]